jgi:hypothetical protein
MSTRPYYFFCEGVAAIAEVPRDFSSEQWGQIQRGFEALAVRDEHERKWAFTHCHKLWPDCAHAGIAWHSELANRDGCSFMVLPMPESTPAQIEACVAHIRRGHDVVRLRVLRPKRWENEALAQMIANTKTPAKN